MDMNVFFSDYDLFDLTEFSFPHQEKYYLFSIFYYFLFNLTLQYILYMIWTFTHEVKIASLMVLNALPKRQHVLSNKIDQNKVI